MIKDTITQKAKCEYRPKEGLERKQGFCERPFNDRLWNFILKTMHIKTCVAFVLYSSFIHLKHIY